MRKITKIIVHCADTPEGRDDKAADIRRWHKARGFNDIGYHYVVDLDGTIEPGRDVTIAGAHTTGHNADSIGVCYIGGLDASGNPKDTRTPQQREALRRLVADLQKQYPGATVHGHREFAAKACPSFDVKTEL